MEIDDGQWTMDGGRCRGVQGSTLTGGLRKPTAAFTGLPQVGDINTPHVVDIPREYSLYDVPMPRVYLADARPDERNALRLLLLDLNLEVAGEAGDWVTTFSQAPTSCADMLLVDWDLLPDAPTEALENLRKACPAALVIVLISHLDARQQAALSAGADMFISKGETADRVAERLRAVAASIPNK
jgi:CheY-like chemotaxis protein